MTDLRKAAEMALEALEQTPTANKLFDSESYEKQKDAIDALRQALAQQERLNEITRQFVGVNEDGSERWVETEYRTVIRSEWVGLTDEEIKEIEILYYHDKLYDIADLCRLIEKRLMKKNLGGINV